jgi:hypothetical protein
MFAIAHFVFGITVHDKVGITVHDKDSGRPLSSSEVVEFLGVMVPIFGVFAVLGAVMLIKGKRRHS